MTSMQAHSHRSFLMQLVSALPFVVDSLAIQPLGNICLRVVDPVLSSHLDVTLSNAKKFSLSLKVSHG